MVSPRAPDACCVADTTTGEDSTPASEERPAWHGRAGVTVTVVAFDPADAPPPNGIDALMSREAARAA